MRSFEAAFEAQTAGELARTHDHRASALMNLGIAELWSLHLDDGRRDLEEALALARRIRRPYLEIGCLGHLALGAVLSGSPVPGGLRLSEEAVAIADAHGWGTHLIVVPAVAAGAAALAWLGRFDEAQQWLDRVERAQPPSENLETEPILHHARGFVRLGQGQPQEALAEFRAAERMRPSLAREHALPMDARGWTMHTQILMGEIAAARAALAAIDPEDRHEAGLHIWWKAARERRSRRWPR
jgi:LuxR family maltose regulon positive regulatory protein